MLPFSFQYILRSHLKRSINVFLLSLFFMAAFFFVQINFNKNGANLHDLFFMVFHDGFLLIIITPLFIFWMLNILSFYDNDNFLLKYNLLKDWWRDKSISLCFLVILYVSVFNFIFLISVIASGLFSYFSVRFLLFFIFTYILQSVGFLIIGFIFLTLNYILNNKIISGLITYLIIIVPSIIQGLFYKELISLLDIMFLKNPKRFGFPISLLILSLGLLIIVFLNYFSIKKKDIYWRNR
jgi:ABC-2 type transport system permease protein